jgi:hypothetical protein
MESRELSAEQTGELRAALIPHINYLLRLSPRLEDLRFRADNPLRVAATRAYRSAWRLYQEAHRLSVRMGSGRCASARTGLFAKLFPQGLRLIPAK